GDWPGGSVERLVAQIKQVEADDFFGDFPLPLVGSIGVLPPVEVNGLVMWKQRPEVLRVARIDEETPCIEGQAWCVWPSDGPCYYIGPYPLHELRPVGEGHLVDGYFDLPPVEHAVWLCPEHGRLKSIRGRPCPYLPWPKSEFLRDGHRPVTEVTDEDRKRLKDLGVKWEEDSE
ncbi:MAG TPA: hypothetical protein VLV83_26060, partial [Acidobacteriota bacterium]|nr:hypothetical protein [Acidobacteriota bacterium]